MIKFFKDGWKNKKELYIIFGIFLFAFTIRVIFSLVSKVPYWDEGVYSNIGYDLSKNFFEYSLKNSGWGDFIHSINIPYSWPNIGFRAPLLPVSISVLYFFGLSFFIKFLVAFFGAATSVLVYISSKKIFNKKVAVYASIFMSLIPIHVLYSGKILTDVYFTFFVLLTCIIFWVGFEENITKYKLLFGFVFALTLYSRYTALWMIPVFGIYLILRDKSFKFLSDRFLWMSIGIFFISLIPWFIYGWKAYGNILGAFIHGFLAATYWGGVQPWTFFINLFYSSFFIVGILFIISLIYIFHKKLFLKNEFKFLLVWFFFFFIMASIMPHKEDRMIMAITPVIAILAGFMMSKISWKREKLFLVIGIVSLIFLGNLFINNYNMGHKGTTVCFYEATDYLNTVQEDARIFSDESAVVFYITKRRTQYHPEHWAPEKLKLLVLPEELDKTYIIYTNMNRPLYLEKNIEFRKSLEDNFKKVFVCNKDGGLSEVYKYKFS